MRITRFGQWARWAILLMASAGCGRNEIRVYWTPKEEVHRHRAASEMDSSEEDRQITWQTPKSWTELPGGPMQAASFTTGSSNQQVTVSIIPLAGMGAGDLEIANLYRSTLELPPLGPGDPPQAPLPIRIGDEEGKLFELVSDKPLLDGKSYARLLVAQLNKGQTSWFFKMTGEDVLVREQKPVFLEFLKSVSFSPQSRPGVSRAASSAPGGSNLKIGTAPAALPQWQVPPAWQPKPASTMRLANFLVEGEGGTAEISVTVFGPGEGGDILANINRWRGQIGLGPVDQATLPTLTEALDPALPGALIVNLGSEGKPQAAQPPQRILAAIVPHDGQTWFYKMMGASSVVAQQRETFLEFVKSVRYTHEP